MGNFCDAERSFPNSNIEDPIPNSKHNEPFSPMSFISNTEDIDVSAQYAEPLLTIIEICSDRSLLSTRAIKDSTLSFVSEMVFPNGKYTGLIRGDKKVDLGTFQFDNGCIYRGNWENDLPNGLGLLISPENIKYKGDFVNGKFQGSGVYKCNDSKYKGKFYNNLKHGYGREYIGQTIYKGEFVNGKKHGKGKLHTPTLDFNGTFKNGKFSHGNLKYKATVIEVKRYQKADMESTIRIGKDKLKILGDVDNSFMKAVYQFGSDGVEVYGKIRDNEEKVFCVDASLNS